MKRVLCVLSLVVVATGVPAAFSHSGGTSAKCGPRMSVIVWPHGHNVIPSVNFPAIVNPHVEVYVGWSTKYPDFSYGGYVVGGKPKGMIPVGDINLHLGCLNVGTSATATATVAGGVTYRSQTGLKCAFSSAGVFDLIEGKAGARVLILHAGKKILLRADASPTKASVTVPKGVCKTQPVPR